ncbi:hypothetical protein V6N11_051225 [Hibiscus sabdariffa]|uniref:Uncharacterized protein n=2 Tax=Hibiscus sabdariffa TaxID=183260 RepID=A0ABR2N8S5_9ROSI
MNASVRGGYGVAGFGSILCDHVGNKLLKFSLSFGLLDPIGAELKAIHTACFFYANLGGYSSLPMTIESDCQIVVKWILSDVSVPLGFRELVCWCRDFFKNTACDLVFAYRDSNSLAHCLARQGAGMVAGYVQEGD